AARASRVHRAGRHESGQSHAAARRRGPRADLRRARMSPGKGKKSEGAEEGGAEPELLRIDGREVSISNPQKVLFPGPKHTKSDLVRYYLAVAEGALRGAGGRPNVLVRYPNGIGGDYFYQKRAPTSRPPWVEVVSLRFPSGRTAE